MDSQDQQHANRRGEDWESHSRGGKVLSGMIVVAVGVILLARRMGVDIPYWVTSWEMLIIAIGLFVGAKRSFRGLGWMIPITIGVVFLIGDIVPDWDVRFYLWPVIIIAIGLWIMVNPRKSCRAKRYRRRRDWGTSDVSADDRINSDDYLDAVSVFGGIEKNIVTKDFKGGEVLTFFGGSSINLSQADIKDKATLELTQVFGGTQLIIPVNWRLKSELTSVFGGIEDKRGIHKDHTQDPTKTLILRGTSVFGGIEIKSY